jgi:hypothetical protein
MGGADFRLTTSVKARILAPTFRALLRLNFYSTAAGGNSSSEEQFGMRRIPE